MPIAVSSERDHRHVLLTTVGDFALNADSEGQLLAHRLFLLQRAEGVGGHDAAHRPKAPPNCQ